MFWSLEPLQALPIGLGAGMALLIGIGLAVGVVSAAFGIGGGFVITPICHALLGMPASLAVATSMGQIPLLSLSGVWRYWQAGQIAWPLAAWLLLGALPSAQIVAHYLAARPPSTWPLVLAGQTWPDLALLAAFTLCIGGLGVYNLSAIRRPQPAWERPPGLGSWTLVACGCVFGALSALLGIGGGFFAVPLFSYFCGLTPVAAVATSLAAVLVTSAFTTLHYLWLGHIYFGISLIIALGSFYGGKTRRQAGFAKQAKRAAQSLGARPDSDLHRLSGQQAA